MVFFPQASPPTSCEPLHPLPYVPHALPISFVSVLPLAQYWVSTDHSAPRYAAFSIPVTSRLLGANTLKTLFSNNHSLRSSLKVSDQVIHPYKTTGKIVVLYYHYYYYYYHYCCHYYYYYYYYLFGGSFRFIGCEKSNNNLYLQKQFHSRFQNFAVF
jgi:hypothetical protein